MSLKAEEVIKNLPVQEHVTLRALLKALSSKVIWVTVTIVVVTLLFPLIRWKLSKKSKTNEKTTSIESEMASKKGLNRLKKAIGFAFIAIFGSLMLYAASLFQFSTLYAMLTSKSTAITIVNFVGIFSSTYTAAIGILVALMFSSTIWVFAGLILLVTGSVYAASTLNELPKPLEWVIPGSFKLTLAAFTAKANDVKNAFLIVNTNLLAMLPAIGIPAIMFTFKIVLMAIIAKKVPMKVIYMLPLVFLVDWAYNFNILLSKFLVLKLVDRKNYTMIKDTGISRQELVSGYFDLCYLSLQLTFFSCWGAIIQFFTRFSWAEKLYLGKFVRFLERAQTMLRLAFHAAEWSVDKVLFRLAIAGNTELELAASSESKAAVPYSSSEETTYITERVYSMVDVKIMTALSTKSSAMELSLLSSVAIHFLLSSDMLKSSTSFSTVAGAESFNFLVNIMNNLKLTTILVLFLYFFLANYVLAVETTYVMNKKREVIKEMNDAKERKRQEQIRREEAKKWVKMTTVEKVQTTFRKNVDLLTAAFQAPLKLLTSLPEPEDEFFTPPTTTEELEAEQKKPIVFD